MNSIGQKLTPAEEEGLRTMLNDLLDSDLFSLAYTVTKKIMSEPKSRIEAINGILSCTKKPSDLLNCRRMTRRVLLGYLINQKIQPLPTTKRELVIKCLEEWGSTEQPMAIEDETSSKTDMTSMGTEYSRSFFTIYNKLQDFGPQHFYPKCSLVCTIREDAKDFIKKEHFGGNKIASFLSELITVHHLYFDINTSPEAVSSCEQDPYGLITIAVSGEVHPSTHFTSTSAPKHNGLFDWEFVLVRDKSGKEFSDFKILCIEIKAQVTSHGQHELMQTN